jgi:hypothetical protein
VIPSCPFVEEWLRDHPEVAQRARAKH